MTSDGRDPRGTRGSGRLVSRQERRARTLDRVMVRLDAWGPDSSLSAAYRREQLSVLEISHGLVGVRRHPLSGAGYPINDDEAVALDRVALAAAVLREELGELATVEDLDRLSVERISMIGDEWDSIAATAMERHLTGRPWSIRWWERHRARELTWCKHQGGGRRGKVKAWSRGSRRRMIRRLVSLDWSDFEAVAGSEWAAVLVSLTCPGDALPWRCFVPDGAEFKRLVRLWRQRLERAVGKVCAVWKVEYQVVRGAPHAHIFMMVPRDWSDCATRQVLGGDVEARPELSPVEMLEVWARRNWTDLVMGDRQIERVAEAGPEFGYRIAFVSCGQVPARRAVDAVLSPFGCEQLRRGRVDHLAHGTDVSTRWSDNAVGRPADIGSYFAKHGSAGGAKAGQNEAPRNWQHLGRWWGVWRMVSSAVDVNVPDGDAVEIVRRFRKWWRSPKHPVTGDRRQGEWVEVEPRRIVDRSTGEVRVVRRKVWAKSDCNKWDLPRTFDRGLRLPGRSELSGEARDLATKRQLQNLARNARNPRWLVVHNAPDLLLWALGAHPPGGSWHPPMRRLP